jgi:hypothetical protein
MGVWNDVCDLREMRRPANVQCLQHRSPGTYLVICLVPDLLVDGRLRLSRDG